MPTRAKAAHFLIIAGIFCQPVAAQAPPPVDPGKQLWNTIKQQLMSPGADDYFESSIKDARLPALTGTLVAAPISDSGAPPVMLLGLTDAATPDVTLVLHKRAAGVRMELSNGARIDFQGVGVSFNKNPFQVVFDVEDFQEPIADLGRLASNWYFGPDLGQVRNGRYQDAGVEFDLPAGWSVRGRRPSIDGGDLVVLTNTQLANVTAAVYVSRHKISSAEIPSELQHLIAKISAQRSDLAHYAIRAESVRATWIGGQQALSAVAHYENGGQTMSEILTWIVTERAEVVFFARTTPDNLPDLRSWFDRLVYTALVR